MADKIVEYTKVSLKNQNENFSLRAQHQKIQEFAEQNHYEIVRIYRDTCDSGKDLKKREGLKQMLEDIKLMGDIKYVVVDKLSRFGRSSIDILNFIIDLQKHDIELYAIEDEIDTGTPKGKIMVCLLGALAEIVNV